MARELFATIEGRSIEAASPLIATGKLAQLANGFLYGEGADDPVFVHSLKIDWLRELVESLDGEPLLIAYEFVEDLRSHPARLRGGAGARRVDVGARRRRAWSRRGTRATLPLLAFHPASAGHGLNLQHGGSRMAWLSPSWSAELTEQAIARLYRPGQTQHVTIHVCVAAGTVDEMKRDRVHRQDERAGSVPAAPGADLMQARTAFRLAMLANGYQPLLNDCKRSIEPGWPTRVVDEAEVLVVGPQRADLDRPEDRRRSRRDRCRRERRGSRRGAGGRPRRSASPSCSRAAWCATPAAPRKPGSRASRSRSGGSPRGAGIAAATRTIRRCRSTWSNASARSERGSSRSTGRMPAARAR